MPRTNDTQLNSLIAAVEAINNLTAQDLGECFEGGQHTAMIAHHEIDLASINQQSGIFYRHLVPWRKDLVSALANSYRRYFKLALAHPREIENQPDLWAGQAIHPAISVTLEQLRDWYILACDGENKYVRHMGSTEFVPGGQTVSLSIPTTVPPFPLPKSWRAPAWLFQVSIAYVGVGPLKTKNIPANDSEERLGAAHTRLLLKGARRVFLWEMEAAIETVRNEEIAAAGAIPRPINGEIRSPDRRRRSPKRDKQRIARDREIAEIADVAETNTEFLQIMDERKVKPLPSWSGWPGSWVQAYKNPRLRKLIHQDKSRAIARVRVQRKK